eukprot:CAMPEP_0173189512 /NCGR_PEP_ID=MMETSP1141-20130122/11833_1 /TAXON_ID=483371 /ORGANISM="non described non described, Strain CCMP2298" /LENGTH=262 /DNA_ID=CAMNT_0014113523 /DNA_START=120 /DNA_END=909 /DNA_ORIENTATION=-
MAADQVVQEAADIGNDDSNGGSDDYVYESVVVDPQILKIVTERTASGFLRFEQSVEGATSDDSISTQSSTASSRSSKGVCFDPKVRVCLVPSRTDLQGEMETLFWDSQSYQTFKGEALEELREYWALNGHRHAHAKQALEALYQPSAEDLLPPGESKASTLESSPTSSVASAPLEASSLVVLNRGTHWSDPTNDDTMSDTTSNDRSSDDSNDSEAVGEADSDSGDSDSAEKDKTYIARAASPPPHKHYGISGTVFELIAGTI